MFKFVGKLVVAGWIFAHSAVVQGAIIFTSGTDDQCMGCSLSSISAGSYTNPTGSGLEGANWIQDAAGWSSFSTYTIWETSFASLGADSTITSLLASFDDALIISSGGQILFDSRDYHLSSPWAQAIDIIALTGQLEIDNGNTLEFFVDNFGGGATGVIWKGTAVTSGNNQTSNPISAPGSLLILSLGLLWLTNVGRNNLLFRKAR